MIKVLLIILSFCLFSCSSPEPVIKEKPVVQERSQTVTPNVKKTVVMVAGFKNDSQKEHEWIGIGMQDTVTNDLKLASNLNVITQEDRTKAFKELSLDQGMGNLTDQEEMDKIAKIVAAEFIVTGNYVIAKDNIRIFARIAQSPGGVLINSVKLTGNLSEISKLQTQIISDLFSTSMQNSSLAISSENMSKILARPKPGKLAYEIFCKALSIQNSEPKKALKLFEESFQQEKNYAEAYYQAGYTAGSILNQFNKSLKYLNSAEEIYKEYSGEKSSDYASILSLIGLTHLQKGETDSALDVLLKAKSILESIPDTESNIYSSILNNIGSVYQSTGDYDKSIEYYVLDKKLEESKNNTNTVGYSSILTNLGVVHLSKKEFKESEEYFNGSKSIKEKLGLDKTVGYAKLILNFGTLYHEKKDFNTALKYYKEADKLMISLGLENTNFYSYILANIGSEYFSKNKFDKALEYYEKSQKIKDKLELSTTSEYADLIFNIANIHYSKKDRFKALEYYTKSYKLYLKLNKKEEADEAQKRIRSLEG